MTRKIKYILVIFFALITTSTPLLADRVTRYVPGISTYGTTQREYECGRCGKTVSAGSGHSCTYDDGRSRSSRPGGGYQASDAEGDAVIASDPSLQINNTYMGEWTPVPSSSTSYENTDSASSSLSSESGNSFLKVILFIGAFCIICGLFAGAGILLYLYRNKLKK